MNEEVIELPKPVLIEDLGMMYSTENSKRKSRYGIYECGFCGTEFKTCISSVKSGETKSCGCYNIKRSRESNTKHGLGYTRLYKIWKNMKDRTFNPKCNYYLDYGGRGITICEEWLDVQNFYTWAMANGYSDELSIDRINNDGNYCPENCRWTTQIIQSRNQRIRKDNTSGYKGVSYFKRNENYRAYINIKSKRINLGSYKTALEGAIAYNNYIIENNLEGFILNEIPEDYLNQITKEEN